MPADSPGATDSWRSAPASRQAGGAGMVRAEPGCPWLGLDRGPKRRMDVPKGTDRFRFAR